MNTSLACQERVLGKLVLAEALGRGLNMRKAVDLVCRGWKTNLTLAQPLGCIIRCKLSCHQERVGYLHVHFCFGEVFI